MPRDTPLARLEALVHPATYSKAQCVRALAQAHDSVPRAAELLLTGAISHGASVRSVAEWIKPSSSGPHQVVCVDDSESESGVKGVPGTVRKRRKVEMNTVQQNDFMVRFTPQRERTSTAAGARRPPEKALDVPTRIPLSGRPVTHALLPTISLHASPVPHPLACALYRELLVESDGFERHEWFLAGRKVSAPHTSGYYHDEALEREDARGAAEEDGSGYWYAGKKVRPAPRYPPRLQEVANIISPFVNDVLRSRSRQPLEYAGEWRASYAAVNHYQGAGSSVGWHADQLTYLGPCTTIVSLSLGTPREFRLRPVPDPASPSPSPNDAFGHPIRTYALRLAHNSLCIMHAGTQELYKHTVPPASNGSLDMFKPAYDEQMAPIPPEKRQGYTSRINITFRFYRPDFRPYPGKPLGKAGTPSQQPRQGTPVCRCGIQCILRADQKGKVRASTTVPTAPSPSLMETPTASSTHSRALRAQGTVQGALAGMIYFWQCQSSSVTGSEKGCGFFRVLDWRTEGRGPCLGDRAVT
ncbi:hypothetical protein NliqN6_5009 [Naganishia liquefaciens]|uniref:Fe2OG dioxygenase domain-containing protein n=1 Tax=Naganishia liquefaciens TaxID=104408 RepID=A0A8H3TWW3_9TREE|nr:hypothetical protein NliqN6_5009 [Naganishia liquefaciens]